MQMFFPWEYSYAHSFSNSQLLCVCNQCVLKWQVLTICIKTTICNAFMHPYIFIHSFIDTDKVIWWIKTLSSIFPLSFVFVYSTLFIYFHLVDLLLKGRVTINAKPGMKLEIPDGVVIENEVSHLHLFAYFVYVIVLISQNVPCLLCFPGH